jgi:hypothetical protein
VNRDRDRDPSNRHNWHLSCRSCARRFPSTTTMGAVQQHFISEHQTEQVMLSFEWVGLGPPPHETPTWMGRN